MDGVNFYKSSLNSEPWIWKSLLPMVLCLHLALGESALKSQSIRPNRLVWIN